MKQAILALALMMAASSASATGTLPPVPVTVTNFPASVQSQSFLASGFESIVQAGNATVNYLPIHAPGFSTLDLCNDFLSGRRALALGLAANSKPQTRKVDADCYPQTSVPE